MFGRHDPAWRADLARVGVPRALLKEQSLWAIWVYRFGRRTDLRRDGIRKRVLLRIYWLLFHISETMTGISLPKSCTIGKGLRIWHFGGVFVNGGAVIGDKCTLRHGVTIGNRYDNGGVPVLGDDVEVGACAQILGAVHVGNKCRIGAMTLVLTDMPDGSTAVGQPARIIALKCKTSVPSIIAEPNRFEAPVQGNGVSRPGAH
jgi:serine O-acetyltransferase